MLLCPHNPHYHRYAALVLTYILNKFSGYGNFATVTFKGRLFCLIFGIIGIPFMLSVLADVGGIFAGILQIAWNKNKNRIKMIAKKMQIEKYR